MLKVRDNSRVPPHPYKYRDPDDGTVLESVYYNNLLGKAKEYRRANNYPIGQNFNDQFEQIVCASNPEACIEFDEPGPLARSKSLMKALANWTASGFKLRSQEEIDRVMAICRECNFYDGESGILKVVCKVCKCSRKKTAIATEHCPVGKW